MGGRGCVYRADPFAFGGSIPFFLGLAGTTFPVTASGVLRSPLSVRALDQECRTLCRLGV